jgi:hypothetical protein
VDSHWSHSLAARRQKRNERRRDAKFTADVARREENALQAARQRLEQTRFLAQQAKAAEEFAALGGAGGAGVGAAAARAGGFCGMVPSKRVPTRAEEQAARERAADALAAAAPSAKATRNQMVHLLSAARAEVELLQEDSVESEEEEEEEEEEQKGGSAVSFRMQPGRRLPRSPLGKREMVAQHNHVVKLQLARQKKHK